ncbi:hypothetical protein AAMO2058_001622100 [Amorphochlora amoebiformis]
MAPQALLVLAGLLLCPSMATQAPLESRDAEIDVPMASATDQSAFIQLRAYADDGWYSEGMNERGVEDDEEDEEDLDDREDSDDRGSDFRFKSRRETVSGRDRDYEDDEYDDNDEMDSPDNENEREDDDYVTERRDTAHSHAHRFREASPDERKPERVPGDDTRLMNDQPRHERFAVDKRDHHRTRRHTKNYRDDTPKQEKPAFQHARPKYHKPRHTHKAKKSVDPTNAQSKEEASPENVTSIPSASLQTNSLPSPAANSNPETSHNLTKVCDDFLGTDCKHVKAEEPGNPMTKPTYVESLADPLPIKKDAKEEGKGGEATPESCAGHACATTVHSTKYARAQKEYEKLKTTIKEKKKWLTRVGGLVRHYQAKIQQVEAEVQEGETQLKIKEKKLNELSNEKDHHMHRFREGEKRSEITREMGTRMHQLKQLSKQFGNIDQKMVNVKEKKDKVLNNIAKLKAELNMLHGH